MFWDHDVQPLRLLTDLFSELGRANIREERLSQSQQETLSDIQDAIGYPSSEGFITLFDVNRVDYSAVKRDGHTIARPQVSLECFLTTKHNLSVRWIPNHLDINYMEVPAPEWIRPPRGLHGFTRPNDELLFIRNFGRLEDIDTTLPEQRKAVDVYLLAIAMVVWKNLKGFVSSHMNVQIQSEPKLKYADPELYHLLPVKDEWEDRQVPVGFTIENSIEAERQRLEYLIQHFEKKHAVAAETFWDVINDTRYAEDWSFEKRSRALKKLGASTLHPSVVRDVRSDILKVIDARIWGANKTVVHLRPKVSQ
jgi:hypothetical protein